MSVVGFRIVEAFPNCFISFQFFSSSAKDLNIVKGGVVQNKSFKISSSKEGSFDCRLR